MSCSTVLILLAAGHALASNSGFIEVKSTAEVEEITEPETKNKESSNSPKQGFLEQNDPNMTARQDSTNIHSLSKFNFIFYFIYKIKYDESSDPYELPF